MVTPDDKARLAELEAELAAERAARATERAEREQLLSERERLASEREHYRALYLKTMELCRKLELGLVGQKREHSTHESQLAMALLGELLNSAQDESAPPPTPKPEARDPKRPPTGRKPLPEALPRVDLEIVPPEVEREGRDAYEIIGEEITETVERRPASLVVVRVRRPKFVRRDRERNAETTVLIGETPALPIERGLAGPALLADTIVRRWQDHLPLHRLEQIYAREGLPLARSTICGWHAELHLLVMPLLLAMWKDAMGSPYLCADASGVLVQAPEKCERGHFWVVVAPERHVLYAYSRKHDSDAIDAILGDFTGYLVVDAHSVYDHLFVDGSIVEVGCWAHARRYFWKALESEPDKAREALALIGELFRVERKIADAPPGKRRAERERTSRDLVNRFFAWCAAEAPTALDETTIARGIRYATNQRAALERFLDEPRLPLSNNISERALRREVVGRKNWLFVGNDDAAEVNAAFVSLLASCQMHGIEPFAYLRDLFVLLPSWPANRVLDLSPRFWKQTLEHELAQQRLAADPFRRISLESPHRDQK